MPESGSTLLEAAGPGEGREKSGEPRWKALAKQWLRARPGLGGLPVSGPRRPSVVARWGRCGTNSPAGRCLHPAPARLLGLQFYAVARSVPEMCAVAETAKLAQSAPSLDPDSGRLPRARLGSRDRRRRPRAGAAEGGAGGRSLAEWGPGDSALSLVLGTQFFQKMQPHQDSRLWIRRQWNEQPRARETRVFR